MNNSINRYSERFRRVLKRKFFIGTPKWEFFGLNAFLCRFLICLAEYVEVAVNQYAANSLRKTVVSCV